MLSNIENNLFDLREGIVAIQTIGRLCKKLNFSDYASRIIHPLARVLDSEPNVSFTIIITVIIKIINNSRQYLTKKKELREDCLQTLNQLVYQLGSDYAIFIPMVGKILSKREIQNPVYEGLVTKLLKNQALIPEAGSELDGLQKHSDAIEEPSAVSIHIINIIFLLINIIVINLLTEVPILY